jgi:Uma2 family endonuclease
MNTKEQTLDLEDLEYPDSDGEPMADNNEQLRLIFLLKGNLDALFDHDDNIAVESDLLWYPVQGQPEIKRAPDAMVIFGRPKQYRGSYRQWRENNIPPQVTFEILSPGNTEIEMLTKLQFYEQYGVEEYYQFNPANGNLLGWLRQGSTFQVIPQMNGWISPLLGIRFEVRGLDLQLYNPDGSLFRSHTELIQLAETQRLQALFERQRFEQEQQRAEQAQKRATQEQQRAEQERLNAEQAQNRAEQEQQRAEQERLNAEQAQNRAEQAQKQVEQEQQRADQERQKAEQERRRAEKLAAKLREQGIDPDSL